MSLMDLKSTAMASVLSCFIVYGIAQAEDETSDALASIDQLVPLSDTNLGVQHARGSIETPLNIDELNLQLNQSHQDAKLNHNTVNSSITGDNSISNGAFTNLTGFATVIQNSGNNVIIQNATIVNLATHQ